MTRTKLVCLAITALTSCAWAQDKPADATPLDRAAIEAIVHDYIMNNPESIEQALTWLHEDRASRQLEKRQAVLTDNQDVLINNPADYTIGPDDAPVTVVEFFDYRCGFCKRNADWVRGMPQKYDGKVRIVFKEMPILSPESEQAALAALAAGKQGKYIDMHMALMALGNASGFSADKIDATAEAVGVDVDTMRADMKAPALRKIILDSKNLAQTLGIDSTPSFVIGTHVIVGADKPAIENLIAEALETPRP